MTPTFCGCLYILYMRKKCIYIYIYIYIYICRCIHISAYAFFLVCVWFNTTNGLLSYLGKPGSCSKGDNKPKASEPAMFFFLGVSARNINETTIFRKMLLD